MLNICPSCRLPSEWTPRRRPGIKSARPEREPCLLDQRMRRPRLDRHLVDGVEITLAGPQHLAVARAKLADELLDAGIELRGMHHARQQTDVQRLLCREFAAGEDHVQ